MRQLLATLAALFVVASATTTWACSAFLVESTDGKAFAVAKSYDWDMDQGIVLTNRRGLAKRALVLDAITGADPTEKPMEWISTHASVTFNQYGAEMPNGGMNDVGLVIEVLWLNPSRYPVKDARPVVNELQWIQWALDTQDSVASLVKAAPKVRVSPAYAKVHYFACDASRACATFEYLGGNLVIHHGDALPYPALTNHTYEASQGFVKKKSGKRAGAGSLARFARVAHPKVKGPVVKTAFDRLDSVSQGAYSVWNIVYVPDRKEIHFRTRAQGAVKILKTTGLAQGCDATPKMIDIHHGTGGDVTAQLTDYTDAANGRLVRKSLGPIARALPSGVTEFLTAYPSRLACAR